MDDDRLESIGRAFLDALVLKLGFQGAAAVLLLLAAEMKTAPQPKLRGRDDSRAR